MKKLAVFVFVFATPVLTVQGQTPPAQGPTFRTGVDVVTVDVAAVDSQGKPVTDLRVPDFDVKIDGQPRRVVSVEQFKVDAEQARRKQADDPFESFFSTNITPPEGRLIVIAVDEMNIKPGNVRPLLNVAANFVDKLSPADRIAFYSYPQPGAFVDFTADHARIRRAMETVTGNQVPYQSRYNIGLYEAVQVILKQDEVLQARVIARECRRANTNTNALDFCGQEVVSDMSRMVSKVRDDRHASLQGLQLLLTRMRLLDGPKSLIIVSEGLVIEDPTDLDDTIRLAMMSQASVNVLMMDVQRGSDITKAVMSPTLSEDRDLQMDGLREMASASRGTLYNVFGNGETIFERLASELSAYYLIGVESDGRDRDDKPHRIDVQVRRRNVSLRSRKAFVVSAPRNTAPVERLSDVLLSPFGVPEIPIRITTFALQDSATSKVRVIVAADVGQTGAPEGRYTIGWALIDAEGKVASSGAQQQPLKRVGGRTDTPLDFSMNLLVEPGVYSLRFGVVDETGRRGSVIREVNAWKMAGEEFAIADLVLGRVPPPGATLLAGVEPHVDGQIAAVLELYSNTPPLFDRTTVTFELADTQDSPALVTVKGATVPGAKPTSRPVQAILEAGALPPGRYVVRARIVRDGMPVGLLARPFVLDAAVARPGTAIAPVAPPPVTVAKFDRAATLAPAVLKDMFDTLEKRSAALKDAVTEARAGRYGTASLEALSSGDQDAAAFLKGLDLYAKGQLDQAAGQLNIAAGTRREFFPAAFFLGASFAAAGRDRDAAAVWQMGIGSDPRPSFAYALFADARLRDGQPQSVVDVLEPAWKRAPADDEIARRLATAYVLTGKHSEAIAVLDALLARHPDDQDALFSAILAQYEVSSHSDLSLSSDVRAKLTRYERAYRGPQKALATKYLETMTAR